MGATDEILEKCIGDEPPACQASCPLHLDVKGYASLMRQGKYDEALALIRQTLPFPGIVGRICTRSCEKACKRQEVDEGVAVQYLKRAAADHGTAVEPHDTGDEKDEKVAVVGGGPAGLMAAYDLRRIGYQVTIFDASPVLGGMMASVVPDYRLPAELVRKEVALVGQMGVRVKLNTKVGRDITPADLRRDFQAVFVATGAPLRRTLDIEGTGLEGVLWGLDFLRAAKLRGDMTLKGRTIVIGGGNVAVDTALTALRLGAAPVEIVYRRTKSEMPAFEWEIEQAIEEGIVIRQGLAPRRIMGDGTKVTGVEFVRSATVAGKGRASNPACEEGGIMTIGADIVIISIGQTTDPCCTDGLDVLWADGCVSVDPGTLETNIPAVFAGGDMATGPGSVIGALASGRQAAASIDLFLRGRAATGLRESGKPKASGLVTSTDGVQTKKRQAMDVLPVADRRLNFREVELGYTRDQARAEAERCLECQCRQCAIECEFLKREGITPHELAARFKAGYYGENRRTPYLCSVCDLCKRVCPKELSVGDMCMEMREEMVASGHGPLPEHKLVRRDQEWSTSDAVVLAQPDPNTGRCDRVFFPGCGLSGYSPELVTKVLTYLQEKLPGTGVLLGCCGSPTYFLGDRPHFSQILADFLARIEKLGASELILACPDCYHTLKHHAPGLQIRALPEVIQEQGGSAGVASHGGSTFSIHDSCKARWERGWQESVRSLLSLAGHSVEEMAYSRDKTRCCGHGGMVSYVDFELEGRLTENRAGEASHTILTYCAACRDALAMHKPAIHILEVLFNPEWEKVLEAPPKTGKKRRENQARLKTMLEKR